MKEVQDIKRLLYPIVKGLPWIILVFILAVTLTWRLTVYQTPIFESKAIIRIDDHSKGFSDNNLYKDLDIFSETNEVLTEVEMIRSDAIIYRAIDLMPTNVDYYRIGDLRTSEMYFDTPFTVNIDSSCFVEFDQLIDLHILSKDKYQLMFKGDTIQCSFNKDCKFLGNTIRIHLSPHYVDEHGVVNVVDTYQFRVNSRRNIMSSFVNEHLFVKEIDKNIGIITIHFEGENPQKVSDFTNAVAQAYLDDHIDNKMNAANLTEQFLQNRMDETERKLVVAESELEKYRLKNRILNVKQETETDLRKLSQLDIQLTNLKMKKVALDSLEKYIAVDREKFMKLSPSYEAYGGLLFTEIVKKMKSLEADKIELLTRFTPQSEEVRVADQKIADLIDYVMENIKNHRSSTIVQLKQIEDDIETEERKMDDLPTVEKNMLQLERNFQHFHDLFNFLKKKQLEAGIAKMAALNFHRIIKKAEPAKKPSSPNKGFNVGLAGFLTLLLSIAFVYILEGVKGRINSRYQLENMCDAPVLGVIKQGASKLEDGSLDHLVGNLIPIINNNPNIRIAINSSISKEGKTYISQYVANTLAESGRKVLLLDFNGKHPMWTNLSVKGEGKHSLEHFFKLNLNPSEVIQKGTHELLSVCGFSANYAIQSFYLQQNFEERLEELTANFDVVIIDCPAYSIASESVVYMDHSDFKLFVVRHDYTDTKYIKNIATIIQKYTSNSVGLVLNGAPKGVNYSGNFYGSRFMYNQPKGIVAKVKHYWESYSNAWNI